MYFQDLSEKACCPYNKNHIFDKEKLVFHINRCKDKQKVGHLFAFCQYNRIHIVPKQDISIHESFCQNKAQIKDLTIQLRQTLNQVQKERQRSREKIKRQQNREGQVKKQVKLQHASDHISFDQCPLCQGVVQKLDQIRKTASQQILSKIKAVQKMIKMNNQLLKIQQDLKKSQKN